VPEAAAVVAVDETEENVVAAAVVVAAGATAGKDAFPNKNSTAFVPAGTNAGFCN
jgi:hypothetical protein